MLENVPTPEQAKDPWQMPILVAGASFLLAFLAVFFMGAGEVFRYYLASPSGDLAGPEEGTVQRVVHGAGGWSVVTVPATPAKAPEPETRAHRTFSLMIADPKVWLSVLSTFGSLIAGLGFGVVAWSRSSTSARKLVSAVVTSANGLLVAWLGFVFWAALG